VDEVRFVCKLKTWRNRIRAKGKLYIYDRFVIIVPKDLSKFLNKDDRYVVILKKLEAGGE